MPQVTWKNKTFGVSNKQAEAAKDLGFSFSWNQDTKALDIIPVSFSVNLLASMGANIEQEIADYKSLAGKTGTMKIAGKQMLPTMQLVGCDVTVAAQAPSGKILDATLSLSFEEYNPAKREKATKSAAASSGATKTQTATLTQTATTTVKSNTTTTPAKTTTTKIVGPVGPLPAQQQYWITAEYFYKQRGSNFIKDEKVTQKFRDVPWIKKETKGDFVNLKAAASYPNFEEYELNSRWVRSSGISMMQTKHTEYELSYKGQGGGHF